MRHLGVDIVEKIERDGKVAVLVSPDGSESLVIIGQQQYMIA